VKAGAAMPVLFLLRLETAEHKEAPAARQSGKADWTARPSGSNAANKLPSSIPLEA
jgi:hypothetical protein